MMMKHAVMAYFDTPYLWNDQVQKLLAVMNCLKITETKRTAPHQILPPEPQN
jgi:hypothetical protein